MAQKTFLIHERMSWGIRISQVDLASVRRRRKSKPTGRAIDLGRMGRIPVYESTKEIDPTKIELWTTGMNYVVETNAKAVKAKIRRLRQAEAAQLDALDAEIAQLRDERKALLARAWSVGNVVTLKELLAAADAREPAAGIDKADPADV